MWIWIANKSAKFHPKRLNRSENIPKRFSGGLLFSETPCKEIMSCTCIVDADAIILSKSRYSDKLQISQLFLSSIYTDKHMTAVIQRSRWWSLLRQNFYVVPCNGARMQVGYVKICNFRPLLLYLGNNTRSGRIYRGTPIGTRMQSIEWWNFRHS